MRFKSIATVVAVCVVALPLAACGSNGSDSAGPSNGIADQAAITAFQRGAQATLAATDVVANGTVAVDGVQSVVASRYAGNGGESTITSKKGKYQVIRSGQFIYVRGSVAFWSKFVGPDQALKINTRWAQSLVDGPLSQFNYFVDRNSFFRASGKITKGSVTTKNGVQTLPIIDPKSNTDSTWWFGTTGEPVLYKYRSSPSTTFDLKYDDVVVIQPPPPEDVIDIGNVKVPTTRATPLPTKK